MGGKDWGERIDLHSAFCIVVNPYPPATLGF
jgi:hypothetical protein